MKTYYINLDTRPDRRTFMETQFAALGISAERIAATTPAEIGPEFLKRHCDPINKIWIAPTELAVSLSHRKTWQAMLDEGLPCALVLEDDVYLSSYLPAFLEDIELDCDALDLIRIETRYRSIYLSASVTNKRHGVKLHRPLSFEWGCAGYVITAACARRLLAVEDWFAMPVDNMIFDPESSVFAGLKTRQTVPGLCAAGYAVDKSDEVGLWKSNIQDDRDARHKSIVFPIARGRKLGRELRRVRSQIGNFLALVVNYLLFGYRWRIIPFQN